MPLILDPVEAALLSTGPFAPVPPGLNIRERSQLIDMLTSELPEATGEPPLWPGDNLIEPPEHPATMPYLPTALREPLIQALRIFRASTLRRVTISPTIVAPPVAEDHDCEEFSSLYGEFFTSRKSFSRSWSRLRASSVTHSESRGVRPRGAPQETVINLSQESNGQRTGGWDAWCVPHAGAG